MHSPPDLQVKEQQRQITEFVSGRSSPTGPPPQSPAPRSTQPPRTVPEQKETAEAEKKEDLQLRAAHALVEKQKTQVQQLLKENPDFEKSLSKFDVLLDRLLQTMQASVVEQTYQKLQVHFQNLCDDIMERRKEEERQRQEQEALQLQAAYAAVGELKKQVQQLLKENPDYEEKLSKLDGILDRLLQTTPARVVEANYQKLQYHFQKLCNDIQEQRKEQERQRQEQEALKLQAAYTAVEKLKKQVQQLLKENPDFNEMLSKIDGFLDKALRMTPASNVEATYQKLQSYFQNVRNNIQEKRKEEARQRQEQEALQLQAAYAAVEKLKKQVQQVLKANPDFQEGLSKLDGILDRLLQTTQASAVEANCQKLQYHFQKLCNDIREQRKEQERQRQEQEEFERKWQTMKEIYRHVRTVPKFNKAVVGAHKTLDKVYSEFAAVHATKDYAAINAALSRLGSALKPLHTFQMQYEQEKKAFENEDAKLKARVELAKGVPATTPGVDSLQKKMYGLINKVLVAATGSKFGDACNLLPFLEKAVDLVLNQQAECQKGVDKFQKQWTSTRDQCDHAIAQLAVSTPEVDKLRQRLEAAQKAVVDKAAVHDYGAAENLIPACTAACREFELAAKAVTKDTALDAYAKERAKLCKDFEEALTTPAIPPDASKLLDELKKLLAVSEAAVTQKDFSQATDLLKPIDKAAQALKALKARFAQEKPEYDKKWEGMKVEVESALRVRLASPALKKRLEDLKKANAAVLVEKDAERYAPALGLLDPLLVAARMTLQEAAEFDKTAAAQAAAAKKTIDDLEDASLLDAQPVKEKLRLLEELRVTATPLDKKGRETQRKIYKSLRIDPEFEANDKERRQQVVKNILAGPKAKEELKQAKAGWANMQPVEKLKVLEKMAAAQAKAFGIDPPQIVPFTEDFKEGSLKNGYFSQRDGKIYMNLHPAASVHDFEAALDIVFHENSHNYQRQLVNRLESTADVPASDRLQAQLFQANLASGGYVNPKEDLEIYLGQPVEEHAHANGPKTAKALLKALT